MIPSPQRIETAKLLGHLMGREDFRAATRRNVPRPEGHGCCFLPCEAETDPASLIPHLIRVGDDQSAVAAIRFGQDMRFLIIRSVADLSITETMAELYDAVYFDAALSHMIWHD